MHVFNKEKLKISDLGSYLKNSEEQLQIKPKEIKERK